MRSAGANDSPKLARSLERSAVIWRWLAIVLLFGCRSPTSSTPNATAHLCAPGSEIERTIISGAQMGQGTTVAFAIPEGRIPTAIAVFDQSEALVACSFFTEPVLIKSAVDFPLDAVGDSALTGSVELSPGEGRYEGRLAIKITTRGNDPFAPYWVVLIGT